MLSGFLFSPLLAIPIRFRSSSTHTPNPLTRFSTGPPTQTCRRKVLPTPAPVPEVEPTRKATTTTPPAEPTLALGGRTTTATATAATTTPMTMGQSTITLGLAKDTTSRAATPAGNASKACDGVMCCNTADWTRDL